MGPFPKLSRTDCLRRARVIFQNEDQRGFSSYWMPETLRN